MRLIDADELMEKVKKWLPKEPRESKRPFDEDLCVSMLMEIEEAPTIKEPKKDFKMSELDKLENYLISKNILYTRYDKHTGQAFFKCSYNRHQIIVYNSNHEREWDASCNYGSLGYEQGLLEVMGEKVVRCDDCFEGYLTADEIIKRLEGAKDDNEN